MVYVPPGAIFANNYSRKHMQFNLAIRSGLIYSYFSPMKIKTKNLKNNKKWLF
jgi:hypothetical protein